MSDEPTRRRITVERFEQLERKVDELLALVRTLAATPAAPTEVITNDQGDVFLPGTGWLRGASEQGRTPEALAALDQLRQRDEETP